MEGMTQSTDDVGGNFWWVVLLVLLSLLVLYLTGCSTTEVGEVEQNSPRFEVVDAKSEGVFTDTNIIVDTETGCQYLWVKESEKAGLTLLVDANGEPLIAKGE